MLEALKEVKKLCGFYENLKTFDNNPKNLLVNLCDGLETFLGYDKTSKGYDGTGIVYSDLDRLCDGVMGFLSGVLSAVKNENEVTTYDKNITTGNLDSVLKTLTSSIGSGRNGLAASVAEVKRWLEGYEGQLNEKIEKVKNLINDLKKRIEGDKNRIEQEKETDIATQVIYWKKRAEDYIKKAKKANEALDNLDSKLLGKLNNNISLLVQATETFQDAAGNEDLHEMYESAGGKMSNVIKHAGEKFQIRNKEMKSYLKSELKKLNDELNVLQSNRLVDLGGSVGDLHNAFCQIFGRVTNLGERYRQEIVDSVSDLKRASDAFQRNITSNQAALHYGVNQIERDIDKLTNLETFQQITNEKGLPVKSPLLTAIGGNSQPFQKLTDYLTEMSMTIVQPINAAIDKINKAMIISIGQWSMEDAVKAAQKELESLKNVLTDSDLDSSSLDNLMSLLLISDMESLQESLRGHTQSLQSIVNKLQTPSSRREKISKDEATKLVSDLGVISKLALAHMDDVGETVLRSIEEQVKIQVKNVAAAIHGNIKKIQLALSSVNIEVFDYGVGGTGGFNQTAKSLKRLVDEFKSDINSKLQTLQSSVGENGAPADGSSIYSNLLMLRNDIGELEEKVENVRKNVEAVGTQLSACINRSQGLLTEAPKVVDRVMRWFYTEFADKIKKAFHSMRSTTKDLYTKRKTQEVAALQKIVKQHFDAINGRIKADKETHFKSFLATLNRFFTSHIHDYASRLSPSSADKHRKKPLLPEEKTLKHFAGTSIHFFNDFLQNLYLQTDFQILRPRVEASRAALHCLLDGLVKSKNFDYTFNDNLNTLENALRDFMPRRFDDPSTNLLAPLKAGLLNFTAQLGHAYVNRYSGRRFTQLTQQKTVKVTKDNGETTTEQKEELTPEGRNCAKVCLTIVEMLGDGFERLRRHCNNKGEYNKHNICMNTINSNGQKVKNQLGSWLQSRGFSVPADKDTQNGELNRRHNGESIIKFMTTKSPQQPNSKAIFNGSDKPDGPLWQLVTHLGTYYKVCHYKHIEKPKAPLNVYQMLQWLIGLWHNPVLYPLFKCIKELFPKVKEDEGKDYSEINRDRLKLEAYPKTVKYTDSGSMLQQVCFQAKNTLVAILGNGHAGGRYAVDFNTNEDNLDYGSSPNACFDMLVDVSLRVYQQIHFLQKQCYNGTKSGGWEDCHYGRHVGGSSWICNEDQCANQNCDLTRNQIADQRTNQNADQTGSQKCNQHPKCGVKSPLQSYLEDGLQGFLPHHLTKVGCGVKCSVGNHFGKPCLTPMGFTDIGILASHTQTGAYIKRAFYDFCGDSDKPLSKLCSLLTCLLRRPPQTLGDMFAFYHQFLSNFNSKHKGIAFKVAVQKANFGITTTELDVTSIQNSSNHNNASSLASASPVSTHLKGDLFALSSCNPTDAPCLPCGRYLQPLFLNMRNIFVDKHADTYLSWIVYITETFYDLLKKLYDECDARCGGEKPKCRISKCGDACGTKRNPGARGVNHESECKSIVKCPDTHPALYRYGFTFGSPNDLSGLSGVGKQRTCHDFCEALKTVVKQDNLLFNLVHKLIPEYLFVIRAPFIWLNVALWLLSLLYLLHIMVIRLDLLHIKSHLHSPSSHRIAAQSLLAAGRVNKLNRVFYLQP